MEKQRIGIKKVRESKYVRRQCVRNEKRREAERIYKETEGSETKRNEKRKIQVM